MWNVIKSELYKLKYDKMIYVIMLLIVGSSFTSTFLFGGNQQTVGDAIRMVSSGLPIFLAVFVSSYATTEFANKTMKNIISCGVSKRNAYLGKLFTAFIMTTMLFLTSAFASIVFNYIHCGFGNFNFLTQLGSFGIQYFVMLIYTTIFFAIGILFMSPKWSMTVNIVLMFGESLIFLMLSYYVVHSKTILEFSLSTVLANLESLTITTVLLEAVFLYFLVGILFTFVSLEVFKKREIR